MAEEVDYSKIGAKRKRGRPKGTKNLGGRPPGSKSTTKLSPGKLLDLFDACYTPEMWAKKFKSLSPESQFKYRSQLEPRAREAAVSNTFQLVVSGLNRPCSKCGHKPEPVPCGKCGHLEVPQAAAVPESSASAPDANDPDAPKVYTPDPDCIARLHHSDDFIGPEDW